MVNGVKRKVTDGIIKLAHNLNLDGCFSNMAVQKTAVCSKL
jgi:hypothetical protein